MFNAISTCIDQICQIKGLSTEQSGLVGGIMLIAGQISGILFIVGMNRIGMIPSMFIFVGFSIIGIILSAMLNESPMIQAYQENAGSTR